MASVDFAELYARHLCRHSQFGINVIHLAALFGVWFGVFAAIALIAAYSLRFSPSEEYAPNIKPQLTRRKPKPPPRVRPGSSVSPAAGLLRL